VKDLNAPFLCNSTGGVPVGGNNGAFITGFSSGPDPMYTLVNKTTGLVRIGMDQRVDPSTVDPEDIVLYDNTGTPITDLAAATVTVIDNGFLSEVDLNVNPSSLININSNWAFQLHGAPNQTGDAAVGTYHGTSFSTNFNVESVVTPTAIAAKFRAFNAANRRALKKANLRAHLRKHRSHRR